MWTLLLIECDKDMGLINCKEPASVPSDWLEIFRSARNNPTPYNVVELKLTYPVVKNMTTIFKAALQEFLPYSSQAST